MTIDDKNLLVKLKSNQSVEFKEKLDNPEGFVSELYHKILKSRNT